MPRVGRVEVQAGVYRFDHFPVTLEVGLSAEDPRWKLQRSLKFFRVNMELARSATGSARVCDILCRWSKEEGEPSALKRLELALVECKEFLRTLGKETARLRRSREQELQLKYQKFLQMLPEVDSERLKELQGQIDEVAEQIGHIEMDQVQGHRVRAGAKWELEGDRPSTFFFQKVQEQRVKKTIEEMLDKEGEVVRGQEGIKKIVEEAYEEVFFSKGPDSDWHEAWEQYGKLFPEKVTEHQRLVMDREFMEEELLSALQELSTRKSPGHDGMTKEFFLTFWMDLKGLVLAAVCDVWDRGSLGLLFNKGLVCLCPKTGDLRIVEQC